MAKFSAFDVVGEDIFEATSKFADVAASEICRCAGDQTAFTKEISPGGQFTPRSDFDPCQFYLGRFGSLFPIKSFYFNLFYIINNF